MHKLSQNMKKLSLILFGIILFAGCSNTTESTQKISVEESPVVKEEVNFEHNYLTIKYRDTAVDVGDPRFEYLNTSKSSFVRGAWYDDDNKYMIINLRGTNYHYCGLPASTWSSFRKADSFGTYYNTYIYKNYDCRYNYVPTY